MEEKGKDKKVFDSLENFKDMVKLFVGRLDEIIKCGGHCPGVNGGFPGKKETDLFVKKMWWNVRVLQALLDAAWRYNEVQWEMEKDDEILKKLREEAASVHHSLWNMVWELTDGMYEAGTSDQDTMQYLNSFGFETLKMVRANMVSDLFETSMIDSQE